LLKKLPSRFGLFLIGLFITTLGDWFTFIALSMRTFEETGMGKSVGFLLLARFIPNVIFGLIIGIWIEKFDRSKILFLSSVLRGFLTLILVFKREPLIVYSITFINSIIELAQSSTIPSVVPSVVKKERLVLANSYIEIIQNILTVVGPSLAGFLALILNYQILILLDVISFFIASFCFLSIGSIQKPLIEQREKETHTAIHKYFLGFPRGVYVIFLSTGILMIGGGMINASMLVYVSREFSTGAAGYGSITATIGLGFLLGSFLTIYFSKKGMDERYLFLIGLIFIAFATLAWSSIKLFFIAMIIAIINGMGNTFFNITSITLLQKFVSSAPIFLFSIYSAIASATSIIGMLIATLTIDIIGARPIFFISGLLGVISSIVAIFIFKPNVTKYLANDKQVNIIPNNF